VLSRALIKKGKMIKIGDKEIDYDPRFRFYLQTKLSNPHYKPEVFAQTTLVNFTVTEAGLEEQLLAIVVNKERPDLEQLKDGLMQQQNQFKIQLKELEDNLLYRLANATGDILGDTELIENLENTKKTSRDIQIKARPLRGTTMGMARSCGWPRNLASRLAP
jgi:dynein heavy chain